MPASPRRRRRAVIIGGSMSGLFTAAFLRRIGWDADVFERSPVELVGRGAPQGKALLEDLIATPQRRLEVLQKRIDEHVKKSMERFTSLPAVQKELSRIEKNIARLEERIGKLRDQNRP